MPEGRAGAVPRRSPVASAAWGWRWEAALGLSAGLAFHLADALVGGVGGGVLVLGLVAVTVGAVPGLRRRLTALLRRRSVDRWFSAALSACGVIGPWGRPPAVRDSSPVPAGMAVRVRIPFGHHCGHLELAATSLAAALRAREVRVLRDPGDAGMATVTVVWRDPLGTASHPWPWSSFPRTSLWQPVPLGVDENGQLVSVTLPEHNLLLGGEPGAGKSAALSLLVAGAALDPAVRLTLLDAKQVELSGWVDSADRFVGPDMDEAAEVLGDLCAEMDHRYEELLRRRRRKVDPADGMALHVVVIDELAFYLRSGDRAKRQAVTEGLRDLVSRGRAAGMIVLAATQKPSHEIVPTWVRDLFGFRLALRCTTNEASDTVLGQGWASQGYSAAAIDPAARGVGFLLHEGEVPVKLRTFYLPDEGLAELADRAARLRGQW
ncbi:MAG: FtsK/SpoIIIE domain-containing protein [Acidimicrobiales bacterium]